MEMQFDRIPVPYLKKLADSQCTREETLEVRLPEGMPDIGHVLGAWGQVIVRGKEWNENDMNLSCGVMAWVLYTPEDGDGVRSLEAWLPFAMKWDLPETRYDGKITAECTLKSIDARSVSARKMLVRAVLCADAQGWQSEQAQPAVPGELPPDVRLLTAEYPVLLPREAGEKAFSIEEQIPLSTAPKPEKLLYYSLQPEITDKKVMAGKVVFRGNGKLHLLYRGLDDILYNWDCELPFSQYADLEGEYSQDALPDLMPCVTGLDLTVDEEGQLNLKAGLLCQYLLMDRTMVAVAEDAYSPNRKLQPHFEQLELPAVLDCLHNQIQGEVTAQLEMRELVDAVFYPGCGQKNRMASGSGVVLPGQFQILYYDMAGDLRSGVISWEELWNIPGNEHNQSNARITTWEKPQLSFGAGTVTLRTEITAEAVVSAGQGIAMLTGMELGEAEKPDPNRPSLILCRKGSRSLWDVAKASGSTVEAILAANDLESEPDENQVLLIPVQ